MIRAVAPLAALAAVANAAVFFSEDFSEGWEDRWTQSKANDELGAFELEDGAIKTSTDAKFYGLSAGFDAFSNDGKDLYVQVCHSLLVPSSASASLALLSNTLFVPTARASLCGAESTWCGLQPTEWKDDIIHHTDAP